MDCTPFRILLIEDNPDDQIVVQRFLSSEPKDRFRVFLADTCEQGWALAQSQEVDCVILDYQLPDGDGLELLRKLRTKLKPVAVVMLTGQGNETTAVESMKCGAQDYIVKRKLTSDALCRAAINAIEKVALLRKIENQQRELERLAITDDLTNIFNRRYFMEQLDAEIDRARRMNFPLSILLLDIDEFKSFNDNFGHLAGDKVLIGVAETINQLVRRTDIVARYGGEEFCVLALGTPVEGGERFADRLRATIAELRIRLDEHRLVGVTVSIGVAQLAANMVSSPQLLHAADKALYDAKSDGRNCVRHALFIAS